MGVRFEYRFDNEFHHRLPILGVSGSSHRSFIGYQALSAEVFGEQLQYTGLQIGSASRAMRLENSKGFVIILARPEVKVSSPDFRGTVPKDFRGTVPKI